MNQSAQLEHIGRSGPFERELYFLSLPDFASMPDSLSLPGRHFVAFLAADAAGIEASKLADFCRKLIQAGCACFCAWGQDCKRVHDIFDEERYDIKPLIMTTWHSDDSLDEALWCFVTVAFPVDEYGPVKSGLAISVGNPEWDKQIRRRLADIDSLNKDVVKED